MQVSEFYDILSDGLKRADIDFPLPEMLSIIGPDEFYLEWIFDDRRFGFVFLEDGSKSGCFILIRRDDDVYRTRFKFNRDYHKAVDCVISTIRSENIHIL